MDKEEAWRIITDAAERWADELSQTIAEAFHDAEDIAWMQAELDALDEAFRVLEGAKS